MIDWSSRSERQPERVSGAWVRRGTRLPVSALIKNLEYDSTVAQSVDWFPGVPAEQARRVLERATTSALAPA